MKSVFIFLFLLCNIPIMLAAQDAAVADLPELDTDRPTQAQGPRVVPWATLQIETGLQVERDKSMGRKENQFFYPTTLIRIGVLKRAELRINTDFIKQRQQFHSDVVGNFTEEEQGLANVQIGTKVALYSGNGFLPQMGILGNITLPVGHPAFRPPHAAPEAWLLFSNKLSEKVELQYNVGYRKRREQEEYQRQALYAVTGSLELTDKIQFFAEIFGQKPSTDKAQHQFDTGFLYKLLPNVQLDVISGWGLNQEAPDYFLGGGVTWRIPR